MTTPHDKRFACPQPLLNPHTQGYKELHEQLENIIADLKERIENAHAENEEFKQKIIDAHPELTGAAVDKDVQKYQSVEGEEEKFKEYRIKIEVAVFRVKAGKIYSPAKKLAEEARAG